MRATILLLSIAVGAAVAGAKSFYSTYLNDFGYFPFGPECVIRENCLSCANSGSADIIGVDTISIDGDYTFKITVRLANRHNREGKRYTYADEATGKTRRTAATSCGVVWNYIDSDNYHAVRLSCDNNTTHDILDKRSMHVDILRVTGGEAVTLKELSLDKNINLDGGFNLVRIDFDGKTTTIGIGENDISIIAQLDSIDYSRPKHYGYLVGRGALVDIERLVIRTQPITAGLLTTAWTKEMIKARMAMTRDAYEGYWTYLDRNTNDSKARLGGRYTVALIKSNRDYDIIYISGARVNSDEWQCGMLKGRLIHTAFPGSYTLVWYDATKQPFGEDEYADFDNSILTLHFPLHDSQIRLFRDFEFILQ